MIAMLKFLPVADFFMDKHEIYVFCLDIFATMKNLIINLSNDELVAAMQNSTKVIEEVLE